MTPPPLRDIASLAPFIQGGMTAVVGLLTLFEALRGIPRGSLRLVWPAVTAAGALLLPAFVLVPSDRPLLDAASLMWRDPQERQHLYIALTLLAGGGVELWRRSTRNPRWSGAWPAALFIIGVLLVTHAEHGTADAGDSARHHVYQGVIAGAAAACFVVRQRRNRLSRVAAIAGPLLLLASAVLLLTYREPPVAL